MRQVQSYFGADGSIDRIQSNEIEDFLDAKKATGRRRNNLRSEIITLFRYAQIRLRALQAPGEDGPGETKKRREKKSNTPGLEIKPILKVTLNASDGSRLRRLLNAHLSKCGEDLTPSAFFSFLVNQLAAPVLEARARTKNLLDDKTMASLGFGRGGDKHPVRDAQNL